MEFCGGHGCTGRVVFLFALSDVTHRRDRGDCKGVFNEKLENGGPVLLTYKAVDDDRPIIIKV